MAASVDTVYDLASLTKPLVTGLLCARRVESGELTLDSAAAQYLPEFDRAFDFLLRADAIPIVLQFDPPQRSVSLSQ